MVKNEHFVFRVSTILVAGMARMAQTINNSSGQWPYTRLLIADGFVLNMTYSIMCRVRR